MARTIRLTAEHIDEISQILRLGLGLALIGVGLNFTSISTADNFGVAAFWAAFGESGLLTQVLTPGLFEAGGLGTYLTPALALEIASYFCFAAGAALILGLLVRVFSFLFALIYFVPWIISLIEAVPFVFNIGDFGSLAASTLTIRDVSMSLLFLVLFNLGSGAMSLDFKIGLPGTGPGRVRWDAVAIKIRLPLAFLFLGAAASDLTFGVPVYYTFPYLTLAIGVVIFFGLAPRLSGALALGVIGWHLWVVLVQVSSFGAAMDVVLPEAPFVAAAIVFMLAGGGDLLKPNIKLTRTLWGRVD